MCTYTVGPCTAHFRSVSWLFFGASIVDWLRSGFRRCHACTKCRCVRDPTQGPRLHLGRGGRFAGAEFGRCGGECRLLLARVAPWKFRIELAKDRENLRFADFVEEGFRARSPVIGRLDFEQRAKFGLKAVSPIAKIGRAHV